MIEISLTFAGHGWLDISLKNEEKEFSIPASYLSDVVEDLICGLCAFIEGAPEVITKIETEPGEYRIRLYEKDSYCILEVYEFDNTFSNDYLENGQIVFEYISEKESLIKVFYSEISKLKGLGSLDYEKQWGYEFPEDSYKRLTQDIKVIKKKDKCIDSYIVN